MSRPLLAATLAAFVLAPLAACDTSVPEESAPATTENAAPEPAPPVLAELPDHGTLAATDLLSDLAAAGLETEDLGPAAIDLDAMSQFPEEPRSTLFLRVSDAEGNSTPMTFVEFDSWETAAQTDQKQIDGFAVRNWFVVGTVNEYFVDRVTEALEG